MKGYEFLSRLALHVLCALPGSTRIYDVRIHRAQNKSIKSPYVVCNIFLLQQCQKEIQSYEYGVLPTGEHLEVRIV
jgi:hypothetical protein